MAYEFITVYCKSCNWQETFSGGVGGLSYCPECGQGTWFVTFDEHERVEASQIVSDNVGGRVDRPWGISKIDLSRLHEIANAAL